LAQALLSLSNRSNVAREGDDLLFKEGERMTDELTEPWNDAWIDVGGEG